MPIVIKTYRVNEIFYSVQGEGARAGTANVFIRFSGCNLTCSKEGPEGFDCDTEFTSGTDMTPEQIALAARKVGGKCEWVVLTGGEPALQLDRYLIDALDDAGFPWTAVETNGTLALQCDVSWVSCSPKTAEHTLKVKKVDELRYVRNPGQGIPRPRLSAKFLYISPAANADGTFDTNTLGHCIELVKANPDWRLSMQQHKLWGVR